METLTAHSGLALIGLLLSHTRIAKRLRVKAISITSSLFAKISFLPKLLALSTFLHRRPFVSGSIWLQPPAMTGKRSCWKSRLVCFSLEVPLTPVNVTSGWGQTSSWLPLDLDVSPFDNGFTKNEGVSRTYKETDGYSPFFAYIGQEGYGVNVNLREGSMHVQKEAAAFLLHSIEYSRRLTDKPLLVRMDAGNDAIEYLNVCLNEQVDFIIKSNMRHESPEEWLANAKQDGMCCEEREIRLPERVGLFAPVVILFCNPSLP